MERRHPALSQTMTWRPVPGFVGDYEVSERGYVRRVSAGRGARAGRVLAHSQHHQGYLEVRVGSAARAGRWLVHRLVALVFIGDPPTPDAQINHIDGNKTNNHVTNLEWASPRENVMHSVRAGLAPHGEHRAHARLNPQRVREIRARVAAGETHTAAADAFGVTRSLVTRIVNGQAWRHVR